MKIKKKFVTSSDIQNQMKTRKRSSRPQMSCFRCSTDWRYISAYISAGGGGGELSAPTGYATDKFILMLMPQEPFVE